MTEPFDRTLWNAYALARGTYERTKQRYDDHVAELRTAMNRAEAKLVEAMTDQHQKRSVFIDEDGAEIGISIRPVWSVSVRTTGKNANEAEWRDFLTQKHGDDTAFEKKVLSKPAITDWMQTAMARGDFLKADVPEDFRLQIHDALRVDGWKG